MEKFHSLYEQYSILKDKLKENQDDFTTDLSKYGMTEDYYKKVDQATEQLCKFYTVKLENASIHNALAYMLNDSHSENVKFCMLIDVLRCYDGLDHPTTFTTPEGIALMILLDKILGNREIASFKQLEEVSSATLSLIDIIPYISECSDTLGAKYSLYLPALLAKKVPDSETLYRRLVYSLCKTIAEVDGVISPAEEDWLNEIALANDDNPNNDVDLNGLKNNCKRTQRWPYVCTGCKNRYNNCPYTKYKYDASKAQEKADINLINSRRGIDVDAEEFKQLDKIIKDGVDNNKSIYQIKIENNDTVKKCVSTLYGYINKGYLTTKRVDLPYAVTYKKRKHNKKYEYSENNKIDRTGHTYLDYLAFMHKNPGIYVWQLDFLGAIKTDNNNILSFILPNLQFTLLDIINKPDSTKVVEFFDNLEEKIGIEAFRELIPVILTDRDPNFADIDGICFSKMTGEERCKLFFCDPYVSNQKPNVENMNKQIRLFFPKGKSVDNYLKSDIKNINKTILNKPLRSLDGNTPKEAFINVFDENIFDKLFWYLSMANVSEFIMTIDKLIIFYN